MTSIHQARLYDHVTPERFGVLRARFDQFILNLDKDGPVVKVYDQLRPEQLQQLAVIREVSQVLQQKKNEDILKAKQAAEEAEKKSEEEEKKEEDNTGEEKVDGVEEEEIKEEGKKETVAALYSQ